MKKLVLTLLLLVALAGLLLAGVYFYEQRWGLDGPFPAHRHHHH
jgi:hypothetical protein